MSPVPPQNNFSPEFDLVRLAASTDPGPESRSRMAYLLGTQLDWAEILGFARIHRVTPLLYQTISTYGNGHVPHEVDAGLKLLLRRIAVQNLVAAREIGRVLPILFAEGVPVIPFKGVILASMAYRNLGLRPSGDIDMLLPRKSFHEAARVLVSNGYGIAGHVRRLAGIRRSLYLRLSRQCQFVSPDVCRLDVHLDVMPPGYRFTPSFSSLFDRSIEVSVGGTLCRTFAPEDMLLILCLHGVKNRWQALKHFCDVSELIRSHTSLDWDVVQRRARQSAAERILLLGLELAREAVGAPVPEEVLRRAELDTPIRTISRTLLSRLPSAPTRRLDRNERFRFHMQVQSRTSTKLRYLLYAVARRAQEKLGSR